jgi:hypothetical protein
VFGIRYVIPALGPNIGNWIANPHSYLQHHYGSIAVGLAIETGIAIALAVGGSWLILGDTRNSTIRPHDSLWTVLHECRPADHPVPILELRTIDRTTFRGPLVAQDPSGRRVDRHLVLGPPLMRQVDGGVAELIPDGWNRVVVPLETVAQLFVRFAPPTPHQPKDNQ